MLDAISIITKLYIVLILLKYEQKEEMAMFNLTFFISCLKYDDKAELPSAVFFI